MEPKECFAYKNKRECDALKKMYCIKEGKCSFFKTKQQIIEENEKINQKKLLNRGIK